jgi:hypothetical protein
MTRPIVFDASHLAHRLRYSAPSGIEKIDFAYARYFGLQDGKIAAGVQYGLRRPRVMSPGQTKSLVKSVQSRWATDIALADDAKFQRILNWLNGAPIGPEDLSHREAPIKDMAAKSLSGLGRALAPALSYRTLPEGAIYLNIAQHALEKPF